jgi:uncharacterized protein (TIGR00725 family)
MAMTHRGRRTVIGVMGGGDPHTPEDILEQAEEAGRLIAGAGAVLLCGGRTGVMEAAARGAKSVAWGETLAVLPGSDPDGANPFIDVAVATGMGNGRNVINVLSSDAILAFPGGAGTLSEIALAIKCSIPLVLCGSGDAGQRFEDLLGGLPGGHCRAAGTPGEAVSLALKLARRSTEGADWIRDEVLAFLIDRESAGGEPDDEALKRTYLDTRELALVMDREVIFGIEEAAHHFRGRAKSGQGMPAGSKIDPASLRVTRLPGRAAVAVYRRHWTDGEGRAKTLACTSVLVKLPEGYRILAEHVSGG